jgi:hypothetical protein
MWMEETIGKRINVERPEGIVANGSADRAVGCPYCLAKIEGVSFFVDLPFGILYIPGSREFIEWF